MRVFSAIALGAKASRILPHLHVLETVPVGVWGLDGLMKKKELKKKIYVGG